MYKVISLVVLVLSLGACQSPSIDDEKMPTAAEVAKAAKESQIKAESQDKIPNPIKCQQAKLNLVEAEGTQDVGQINFAKDAVHQHCDDFE
ncbi:MAG: hypothetical protein NWQ54_09045 [Paraglaciecola sp.]|uniref:hypothetical protein n=1 Tax=Pseudomonadati TaxID=3379134 RepID=UPI00273D802F|nr:hypothetical protein [Paraglaciecola sp.]MDP5029979.1 hypothetical protein [Paraglaciecola sp.]MDP5131019.1 hypothetical protein [Paraglaciecola sp.]